MVRGNGLVLSGMLVVPEGNSFVARMSVCNPAERQYQPELLLLDVVSSV